MRFHHRNATDFFYSLVAILDSRKLLFGKILIFQAYPQVSSIKTQISLPATDPFTSVTEKRTVEDFSAPHQKIHFSGLVFRSFPAEVSPSSRRKICLRGGHVSFFCLQRDLHAPIHLVSSQDRLHDAIPTWLW